MADPVSLELAFAAFLARCDALNLAEGSVAWYRDKLGAFNRFCAERGVGAVAEVRAPLVREYLSSRRRAGQASETIFRAYGALRCAFRFWRREGMIGGDPMELVERPRRERCLIRPLSPEQAVKLVAMPDAGTTEGLRDRALMTLMLDSGLRISEALGLKADEIDWAGRTVTVMGKGRRERCVPFSAHTGRLLRAYAEARAGGPVRAPQFFLGRAGTGFCRSKARKLIRRYGERAGIEGVRLSPHTLRHTFAVLYIRNGGDSFSLQEILGHTTLEMTRQYVNLARGDVAEQHRKFAPMAAIVNNNEIDGQKRAYNS